MASPSAGGPSPGAASPGKGRMLRVEFKGQPYDWFSLDDMGSLIQSEEFASTLKENINHYFNVPFEDQAVFDDEGILVAPVDFKRALQHPRPYFRVFNLHQLPRELQDQAAEKLATLAEEVSRLQQALGLEVSSRGAGQLSCGQSAYPQAQEPQVAQPRTQAAAAAAAAAAAELGTDAGVMPSLSTAGLTASSPWPERSQPQAEAQLPHRAQEAEATPASANCPYCGATYEPEGALFCGNCGRLRPTTPAELRTLPAGPTTLPGRAAPLGTTSSLADRLAGNGASYPPMPCSGGACQVATTPAAPATASPITSLSGLRPESAAEPGGVAPQWHVAGLMRHQVEAKDAEPQPQSFGANGKVQAMAAAVPRQIDVILNKESARPAASCHVCGNVFMPDSEFCRKCGAKREMSVVMDRFGFANVPGQDGRSLQITWIDPAGLLARWNSEHPDRQVKEGDHVVAVNNFAEDVEAMRTQLQLKRINMSVKVAEAEQPETGGLENATRLVLPQDTVPRCLQCGNMYMSDSQFCRRCGHARARADSGMR